MKIEDLIRHYPALRNFGFEIEKRVKPKTFTIKDENGSDITYEYDCTFSYIPYIHVNSVEDIFNLGKALDKNLVFHDDQTLIVIADN